MSSNKRLAVFALLGILATLLALPTAGLRTAQAQETGPNLLVNGDFEQGGVGQAWPFQDGIPEVQIAPGWRAFYLDKPPDYVKIPDYCQGGSDTGCYWGRPEFRDVKSVEYAYRVHGGQLAQKYFSWNRQHEAGLYQQVGGITVGSQLRFQIYMQTWSCLPENGGCPTTPNSNRPAPMHTKVGIDPTGGTNPWASTVVWSGEFDTYDTWTAFWVEATAQSDKVTVFTYSRADWTDTWPRVANDVYLDDASLVVVGEATPTVAPPPPTSSAPPTPRATSTPRPDGAVVHVVAAGDTLSGIAYQYGVDIEELRRLNAGSIGPDNLISVGQELVISVGTLSTPIPTAEPQPLTPTLTLTPILTPTLTPAPVNVASLCVLVYNDQNGDMVRQSDSEELLPGAMLTLTGSDRSGRIYTTDGLNEPYCFQELPPGNYVLHQTPPAGYQPAGPVEWNVQLDSGQVASLTLGAMYGGDSAAPPTEPLPSTTEEPPAGNDEPGGNIPSSLGNISGIIVLVLAIVVAGYFFVSRRAG